MVRSTHHTRRSHIKSLRKMQGLGIDCEDRLGRSGLSKGQHKRYEVESSLACGFHVTSLGPEGYLQT